jgi:hypothetical protein
MRNIHEKYFNAITKKMRKPNYWADTICILDVNRSNMRQLCQCIRYMSSITRNSKGQKGIYSVVDIHKLPANLDFDEGTESSFRISLQSNFAVD